MRKKKILVIDDDPVLLELLDKILSDAGYACTGVSGALEGLKLADSLQPDAVLLDRNMPDMSGTDVLAALKKSPHTSAIPIIMLTGDISNADISKNLEMGARDYIVKPFDPNGLVLRLKNALRK